MSTFRRRVLASGFAVTAAVVLGACGTSFNAQTNQQYQAAEGANARGDVDSMNTVVVADETGAGVISAGVVNGTDDAKTITGITITNAEGSPLTVTPPAAPVEILPGGIVTLGSSEANKFSVAEGADPGSYVTITLTFSSGSDTEVEAPVVDRNETYESVVEVG